MHIMFITNVFQKFKRTKDALNVSVYNEVTAHEFNTAHKTVLMSLLRNASHIFKTSKHMLTNSTYVVIQDTTTNTMAGSTPSNAATFKFYYRGVFMCKCRVFIKDNKLHIEDCIGPTGLYVYFRNDPHIRKHTPAELAEHPLFDKAYAKCMSLLIQAFEVKHSAYLAQQSYNMQEQNKMLNHKQRRAAEMLNEFINTNKS